MNAIMIYHHLGLGDHIVCNGLVRHILDEYKPYRIFIPTKTHNYYSVSKMYWDKKEIVPCIVKTDQDVPFLPCLTLCNGFLQVGFSKVRDDWDVSFYDTNQIPFEYRWSKFKIFRDKASENVLMQKVGVRDGEKFVLVHNKGSSAEYDLKIDTDLKKIFVSPVTDCILDWCGIAEKAQEVHCIDSSFVHLAQTLDVKRGVFHNIRTMNTSFSLKNSWETVDYRKENSYD